MRISIELVPRSEAALERQLREVADGFPVVDTINIPDLWRFELRSWQGCVQALRHVPRTVPHLRAGDIDLAAPLPFADALREHGIDEVLVVAGDAPSDMSRSSTGATSLQVIRKLRRELPQVRVYAALDPYRQGFAAELDYARQKLDAGACGLFSQPFFDLRLLELWIDLLDGVEVFWGVTSVTSTGSVGYWRGRNKVVFPAGFEPTLAWNRRFAREVLAFARGADASLYFMPIRESVTAYLEGILDGTEPVP